MEPILERIGKGQILVGDGAMGSQLIKRGLIQGECPESLNLSNPAMLEEIASLYFEAGSEIIETNTFGGSPAKLAAYGVDDQTEAFNKAAVTCARNAVGEQAYIAGSCGPTGEILKPYGSADPDDIYNGFKRQIGALIEAGADLICVETMTDIIEALLAVKACRDIQKDMPLFATMTFDKTPRGYFTIMGVSVEQAATELAKAGADVLGSNCGNGFENMVEITQEFRVHTDLPLLIQANAGKPELRDGELFYPESPGFFAVHTPGLIEAGVSVIGGCCGTDPEYIKAIRRVVDTDQKG